VYPEDQNTPYTNYYLKLNTLCWAFKLTLNAIEGKLKRDIGKRKLTTIFVKVRFRLLRYQKYDERFSI
jgi:hypothetical protein